MVNAALAEKGYIADKQDFWDTQTSPENCKKAVQNLSVGPDDIIMFYYIGHGGRPVGQDVYRYPYPQMFLAQDSDKRLVPLTWVHDVLKSKGARLTITIGMCCNSETRGMTIKSKPLFSANYGNTYVKDDAVTAIQKLFLENKGDLLATSASPKETSVGYDWGKLGEFDLYTGCLVYLFNDRASSGKIEWNSLFKDLGELVAYKNPEQHPIFTPNIKTAPQTQRQQESQTGNTSQPSRPVPPTSNPGNNNNLEACFDYIIDANIQLSKRLDAVSKLKNSIANNATVKILGQDGNVVIDKESADVFFDRISTSRLLLKVVPVDTKKTSGNKLTEIRVREYYKQN